MSSRLAHSPALSIGMLSTYPPTVCGLATFSSALERALTVLGHRVEIVRADDGTVEAPSDASTAGVLLSGSTSSMRRTSALLSTCDVAIIQHEYGIFGGRDGNEVLEVLRNVDAPLIVVLHTVQQQASVHQADLLLEICNLADRVVVMSSSARERLVETYYPIERTKVVTIPHGAAVATWAQAGVRNRPNPAAELLTWGLLGPGKGIEYVIEAVGLLAALEHPVRFTIAGATHPKVMAREGSKYRDSLVARADALGIDHLVTFDDSYRNVEDLTEFISSAGVVVMPYDTVEQVTSGVLVDSIAAGRPIIATRFPHAVEMLSGGAGILVPQRDAASLAGAIRRVTSDAALLATMEAKARDLAPLLSWRSVAGQYAVECEALVGLHQQLTA